MKRYFALLLTAALLLSGCDLLPAAVTDLPSGSGETPQIDRDTGLALHDDAPSLSEVGVEEYLAYFRSSADFVTMPDFHDQRNPYEAMLAAEKEALGKNFEEYYLDQSIMVAYFENLVEENVDSYNEDKGLDDSVYLYLLGFYSMELAMGSSFSEEDDWAMLQRGMVMAAEMFGGTDATVTRNAAHNYTITYTGSDGGQVVDHFRADLGGGIQMLCYTDGVLTEIFEFRELGNDTYVWQNSRERLVMTYRDKTVLSCWYSKLPEEAAPYGESDLVFGMEGPFDAAWVSQRGDFYTDIRFDGTTLEVTTVNFFIGGIGHAVITPAEQ